MAGGWLREFAWAIRYTQARYAKEGRPRMHREEPPRQEVLTWADVDALIDQLIPKMVGSFDLLVMITRGGIIPGGMIAEALDIKHILTAAVEFRPTTRHACWPGPPSFSSHLRNSRAIGACSSWTTCGRMAGTSCRCAGASRPAAPPPKPPFCTTSHPPHSSQTRNPPTTLRSRTHTSSTRGRLTAERALLV
jgi:hypothetical protein